MPAIRFWALYQAIPQIEAMDDMRAVAVAAHGANPGKDGWQLKSFLSGLIARARGQQPGAAGAHGIPSMPASALRGPFVSEVDGVILRGYRQRMEDQVEEQKQAWNQGGWPLLAETLERQRAVNRGSQ